MKNKNLLITGAATRVGKAIALHFAERGWNIALHYFKSSSKALNLKKVIEQNWVKVVLIKATFTKFCSIIFLRFRAFDDDLK